MGQAGFCRTREMRYTHRPETREKIKALPTRDKSKRN